MLCLRSTDPGNCLPHRRQTTMQYQSRCNTKEIKRKDARCQKRRRIDVAPQSKTKNMNTFDYITSRRYVSIYDQSELLSTTTDKIIWYLCTLICCFIFQQNDISSGAAFESVVEDSRCSVAHVKIRQRRAKSTSKVVQEELLVEGIDN